MTAVNLNKSDTPNHPGFNAVLVTDTAGSLNIITAQGSTLTLPLAPVGVWLPVGGGSTNITTASTAVGLIVANIP